MENIPGIIVEVRKNKPGPPTAKPIQIRLTSQNYDELDSSVDKVLDHIKDIKGLRGIEDTRSTPGIDWKIQVDRAQAAKFGANVAIIGNTIKLITNGYKVDDFRPNNSRDEIDIVVRYPKEYRTLDHLKRLRVITENGLIPINTFVKITPEPKISNITRSNSKRSFSVKADILPGVLADDKAKEIISWLNKTDLGKDVSWKFKGEEEDKKESSEFLLTSFITALFLITIILVTQFNSFFSALLVLSSILMSFIGVLIGLLVTNQPFVIVMGGISIIALSGIIVSNNIILIDTFDILTKTIKDKKLAIMRTGAQRLRPVVLTQLTTILGLLPIMFGLTIDFIGLDILYGAPSTQWWIQIATAIVFGLLFASPLTLIVTPCALMFRENYRAKKAEKLKY